MLWITSGKIPKLFWHAKTVDGFIAKLIVRAIIKCIYVRSFCLRSSHFSIHNNQLLLRSKKPTILEVFSLFKPSSGLVCFFWVPIGGSIPWHRDFVWMSNRSRYNWWQVLLTVCLEKLQAAIHFSQAYATSFNRLLSSYCFSQERAFFFFLLTISKLQVLCHGL